MSNRFIPDRNTPSGAAPGDVQMPSEHEFGPSENEVIGGLAGWMGIVAAISIIFGILQVAVGLVGIGSIAGILTIGQGVCLMLIGGWLVGASSSFKDIVRTSGNDITHLMLALRKLRSAYTLQGVLLVIACVLIAVVLFLAIGGGHS